MTGAWVTWSADVLTWPGVNDITENLDRAIEAMRWERDIDDACYDYMPGARTVTFHLRVLICTCSGLPLGAGVGCARPGWGALGREGA